MQLWGPLTRAVASSSKFTHPTAPLPPYTRHPAPHQDRPKAWLSALARSLVQGLYGSLHTGGQRLHSYARPNPGALAHSQTAPPTSPGALARVHGVTLVQINQPNLAPPVLPLRRRCRRPPACLRSVACCLHSLLSPLLACCRPAAAPTDRQHREAAERTEAGWIPTSRPCRTCRRRSSSS